MYTCLKKPHAFAHMQIEISYTCDKNCMYA